MDIKEIPLTPDNQLFDIVLAGTAFKMRILWRDLYWMMDLSDSSGSPIINGIPLVTGADLLAQYSYLNLGFKLAVLCDVGNQVYPTKTDLGIKSHLYVITE
ncbi:phage baseplate plug family protein [Kluyvera georgiana]|uniref:phage baseplate plug family protein n=1 Tax=Kluyvera georgiana TaxID=73098 RepID=UPI003AEF34FF